MTEAQLQALGLDLSWKEPLETTFDKFQIVHPHQQASFIGQCSHESNHFRTLEENLNYKPEALNKLWPARFPSMEIANQYAHNPEKIANKVYSSRGGNRDESSGDGWRFHGRGLIQLTFHDNYYHAGQAIGVDLVNDPDLVKQPMYAALTAGWFWNTHNLNKWADECDDKMVTKLVNGGYFGLEERIALTNHAFKVLST